MQQQILDVGQQNKRIAALKKMLGLLLVAGLAVALGWMIWVVMKLFELPAILDKTVSPDLPAEAFVKLLFTELIFIPALALPVVWGLFKTVKRVQGKIAAAVMVAEFGLVMERKAGIWQALYYGADEKTIIFGQSESLERAQHFAAMQIIAFDFYLMENHVDTATMTGQQIRQAFDAHVNAGKPIPETIPIHTLRPALKA